MRTPASLARSGMISGTGFAMANIMASWFMEAAISLVTILGAETPMKMSAPFKASARVPVFPSRLVTSIMRSCIQFRPSAPLARMPDLSHMVMWGKP